MGNKHSVVEHPEQFVAQSKDDWDRQLQSLYKSRPTLTKTVVLPPGVRLDDERLKRGQIIEEKQYTLDLGDHGEWPEDAPFEADVSGNLLPPCWGAKGVPAHYVVYPTDRFKGCVRCQFCELDKMD